MSPIAVPTHPNEQATMNAISDEYPNGPPPIRTQPACKVYVAFRPDISARERSMYTASVPTDLDRTLTPAVDAYGVPKPPAALLGAFEDLKRSLRVWADVTAAHNPVRQTVLQQLGRSSIPDLGPELDNLNDCMRQLEYTLKALAITPQTEVGHRAAFYRAVAIATCGHTGKRTDSGAPLPLCEAYPADDYHKGDGVVEALGLDDQIALSAVYMKFLRVDVERVVVGCPAIVKQRPQVASLLKALNDEFLIACRPFMPTMFETNVRLVRKNRHRLADSLMGDAVVNGKVYMRVVNGDNE